ncbi:hypothetical protein COL8621_01803 [Actibacterium lipolyticum]|uniref:Uncharacterized protein n=1 Tax=Actibacterium lipolyticum TaxID=1524263 RepID=A0A238KI01_9RHOB|nr:hypothetical protein COL8621_01803 [Actibacterium lipolyticum]
MSRGKSNSHSARPVGGRAVWASLPNGETFEAGAAL